MKKLFITLATLVAIAGPAYAAVNINTATQAELQTLQGISPPKPRRSLIIAKKPVPSDPQTNWKTLKV